MRHFLLSIMMLLCVVGINAQHTPQSVIPGSKGALPQLPEQTPSREGEICILALDAVYYDFNYAYSNEAWLAFPTPDEIGADSYTLQYRKHGSDAWFSYSTISANGTMIDAKVSDFETDFRLVVHGGDKDNQVSNIVTARIGSGPNTSFRGWSEAEQMYKMMGVAVGSTFQFSVTTYVDGTAVDYDENSGVFTYQWYRQNAYNGDLTLIEGATERTYSPVLADCGYNLMFEVKGDGQHCNFTLYHNFGMVYMPVRASIDYIGPDGFVLNTDYEITNAAALFTMYDNYNGTMDEAGAVPDGVISERKPGQYVFRMPVDTYNGCEFDLVQEGYKLTFVYMMSWLEEPEPWYREAQVMADRYWAPLSVKAFYQNRPMPVAAINLYGYDIDGNIRFVKGGVQTGTTTTDGVTVDVDWENIAGNLYSNNRYFVKTIVPGDDFASTYYPSSLLWEDAQPVVPGYDEDYNIVSVAVNMVQLTRSEGSGVIAGQVDKSQVNKIRRQVNDDVIAAETYSVILKAKNGDFVAQTETDADGKYRFENIAFDTYQVLVSIAGCTLTQPVEVTVDETTPAVEDVNYTVAEGSITTTYIPSVSASSIGAAAYYNLSGSRMSNPQRGLNIIRTSDGRVYKTIIK
ncbi:MAG: hypothetical protein J5486_09520 [Bacteroidaceae bacterium]|nr:hypothetical protein [Bacteroidaceae bacterium]